MTCRVLAAAALLATAAGCSTAPSSSAQPPPSRTTASTTSTAHPTTQLPRCRHTQYAVKMVEGISPMTGEHAFFVQVMHIGPRGCSIIGYPKVAFFTAAHQRMGFTYRDSGGQYLTDRRPTSVNLAPGGSFFVAIAKYRCDLRTTATARYAVVRLPGADRALRISLRHSPSSIDSCNEAPSRVVYLSPIVGNEHQLFAH